MAKTKRKKYWIQEAVEKMRRKGTLGSLTKAAKQAGAYQKGKISISYLEKLKKKGGKMAKKAIFALNVRKGKKKKKKKS